MVGKPNNSASEFPLWVAKRPYLKNPSRARLTVALAATQLGLTEAPVIVLDHLTEAQRRAYRIADNKLTELGTWDEALLSAELNDLLADDYDLSLIGFDDASGDARLFADGRH